MNVGDQDKLKIGIVGAAGRGASFRAAFDAHPQTRIHAVCDVRQDELQKAKERLGAQEAYDDYQEMLERSDLQAVVIGTPMQFHASQAIAALDRDIHVLSEVTAATSVNECRALVAAATRSKAQYMMAENYNYAKPNILVAELARQADGKFSVERVVIAVDCGIAINPDVIKAQMEGGMGYGLSATLESAITIDNGSVVEGNFDGYRVLRMHQMPEVEVHIVRSAEAPTGVGEPATPVIAPAVANALFALVGRRARRLPLGEEA